MMMMIHDRDIYTKFVNQRKSLEDGIAMGINFPPTPTVVLHLTCQSLGNNIQLNSERICHHIHHKHIYVHQPQLFPSH